MRAWQRGRLASSFEPKATARKRKADEPGEKKQNKKIKNHTGNFNNITWDKEQLKEEVKGLADGHLINYSELARKYNICNSFGNLAPNGGQIVKEWLKSEGVNLSRFKDKSNIESKVRRRKRRGPGGEISIPTEVTTSQLKQKLKQKIESGEYTIGEMIVPQQVLSQCY